jgi:uncharacterized protein (TIGR03000 family)
VASPPTRLAIAIVLSILTQLPATARAGGRREIIYDPGSGYSREYYPPSYWGYNLDERHPSYYGGMRYREYYSFARGYGYATYPEPFPNYPLGPYRGLPAVRILPAPACYAQPAPGTAVLVVRVPADAEIWVNGGKTRQTGAVREFVTPPLPPATRCTYEFRVRWQEEGQVVEARREVAVQAGSRRNLDFTAGLAPQPPRGDAAAEE